MREHLSVLMLMARSTIYKVLGIFFLMAAAEGGLFYLALNRAVATEAPGAGSLEMEGPQMNITGMEQVFQQSRIIWIFALTFLLITALLCLTGTEFGGKQGYTLRRLSIPERTIFLWQAFYNTCCFFLLWAVQLFIVLALCKLYAEKMDPVAVTQQTVFLAFYRNSFLHSLLPLAEISRYARNVLLVLGLGISSAYFPFRQRRGETGVQVIILTAIALIFFSRSMGSLGGDIFVIVLSLWVTASCWVSTSPLNAAFREEAENEN